MPIYEYECSQCQHAFDLMQKISAPAISECAKCKSQSARRVVSASGFQLKGSGWYASDYKPKPAADKTAAIASDNAAASE